MRYVTLDSLNVKETIKLTANSRNNFAKKIKSILKSRAEDTVKQKALEAKKTLLAKTGEGSDFLGWIDLPVTYDKDEFERIKIAADKIRKTSDVLVVIGIGGSYLGAKATDSFLNGVYGNKEIEILYAGNSLSSSYLNELFERIGDRDFSVNIISKSGTTTEPAIAFRFFKKALEDKYGTEGAKSRIYATTDKEKGALKEMAQKNGYESFIVPDDVGGRFSVLSAVGLLPIAVSGIDIDKLMMGASDMRKFCLDTPYEENDVIKYAAFRYLLYNSGKHIEVLSNYEPCAHYIGEWWKQLFGESEGKDGKGIFPASVDLNTDLHSMGQYIQDGRRDLFETVINIEEDESHIKLFSEENDLDGLNYLKDKELDFVNKSAMKGTVLAHTDGKVPVLIINVPKRDEYYLGQLFYFFEFAVGISGYMFGVNPFNQPGVESYKKNMFALLGKPGFEIEREKLLRRMEGKNE